MLCFDKLCHDHETVAVVDVQPINIRAMHAPQQRPCQLIHGRAPRGKMHQLAVPLLAISFGARVQSGHCGCDCVCGCGCGCGMAKICKNIPDHAEEIGYPRLVQSIISTLDSATRNENQRGERGRDGKPGNQSPGHSSSAIGVWPQLQLGGRMCRSVASVSVCSSYQACLSVMFVHSFLPSHDCSRLWLGQSLTL